MSLFTLLPITVTGSLPVIPVSDINFANYFEQESYDHWIFDKGASGLKGLVNETTLTAQSTGPTYSSNYLTIPAASGKSMLSQKADSREQTICVVYRHPVGATGTLVLAGSRDVTPTMGSVLFSTSNSVYSNQTPTFQTGPIAEPDPSTWMFAALSESALAGSTTHNLYVGGAAPITKTGGSLKTVSTNKVALGNIATAGASASNIDFAEFILFNRALSADELAALYVRSKGRMAARGVTVA